MSCLSIGSVIIELASFVTYCPVVLECICGILGVGSFTYRCPMKISLFLATLETCLCWVWLIFQHNTGIWFLLSRK